MADTRPRCAGITKLGVACQGAALPGSTLCWFHDPGRAEERARACSNGGKTRMKAAAVLSADAPETELTSPRDVQGLLSRTVYDVLKGRVGTKEANAAGYLLSVLLRAVEVGELAERVGALEDQLRQREASRP